MRDSLTALLLGTIASATGQSPVIGADQFFQQGQTYFRDGYEPPSAFAEYLQEAAGPDYLIDLTPVASMVPERTDSVVREPVSGPYIWYQDYYDTANVRITVYHEAPWGFVTLLFLEDDQGIRHVGGQPNGVTSMVEFCWMRYPDNRFPMELQENMMFGFQHRDTITGEWLDLSGSDEHYVSGVNEVEADGFGTIIMPNGQVIPNTLRLRNVIAVTDSNLTFGVNARQDTVYTWYAEGVSGPLMTMQRSGHPALYFGLLSNSTLAVYRQHGAQAIASRPDVPVPSVFPNPFSERAILSWPMGYGDQHVNISDARGRSVCNDRLHAGRSFLHADRFDPGVYTYVITDTRDQIAVHGKFIVR